MKVFERVKLFKDSKGNYSFRVVIDETGHLLFGGDFMSYQDYIDKFVNNNECLCLNFKFKSKTTGNHFAYLTDYEAQKDYIVKLEK